jgi:hypothetical protein
MTWIDRPEVQLSTQDGQLTAETRDGNLLRYKSYEWEREPGAMETICPTIDHIIAAAGW